MVDDVFNGVFTQRIVEGHAVNGHTVACLHGDHPFRAVGAIDTSSAVGGDADGSHCARNCCCAFSGLLVGEPGVGAIGAAVSEAVVGRVLADRGGKHVVESVDAI